MLIAFTTLISCHEKRVIKLEFRWYAFDDQRIEVISNFNMDDPDDKTFSIKNPNAKTGFVVLTSIHYIGPIYFLLSVIINYT